MLTRAVWCVLVVMAVLWLPGAHAQESKGGLLDKWSKDRQERVQRRAQKRAGDVPAAAGVDAAPASGAATTICGGSKLRAGKHEFSFDFGGDERSYELHVPSRSDPTSPRPLVLSFHGGGGRGKSQRELTGFQIIGEREGFLTAYPDGVRRSWNGGDGDTSHAEKNRLDDVGFVSALIDDISRRTCVDPKRVYASGFSNGGRLTHRLGCELAGRLAAIAPISAPMPVKIAPHCKPARPISVIEMHATTDEQSPFLGGATDSGNEVTPVRETIAGWVARNACSSAPKRVALPQRVADGTSVVVETYTGCLEETEVVLYTIAGAGHTWAGGMQYMPERKIGKTSQQFSASEAIWAFFSRHPMP